MHGQAWILNCTFKLLVRVIISYEAWRLRQLNLGKIITNLGIDNEGLNETKHERETNECRELNLKINIQRVRIKNKFGVVHLMR